MDIDKLVESLISTSVKYEEAANACDSKEMSKNSVKAFEIAQEFRKIGIEACEKIIPLLNDSNNFIKFDAAYTLIPIYHDRARQALSEVSKGKGLAAFRAGQVLKQLEKGELKLNSE